MAFREAIEQVGGSAWNEVLKRVKQAVIYTDDKIANFILMSGGLERLMDSGAIAVRSILDDQKPESTTKKVVFLVSSVLDDPATKCNIQRLLSGTSIDYCIVVSTVPHYAQLMARNECKEDPSFNTLQGAPIFHRFEDILLEWMGSANKTAEVFHFPLFFTPLYGNVFLLPTFFSLAPVLDNSCFHTDFSKMCGGDQLSTTHFVSLIHSLLSSLHASEEVFCIGPLAATIANKLEQYAPAKLRRKAAVNRANVLLIDRSVDLCEPLRNPPTHFLDRILFSLPSFSDKCTDKSVDMAFGASLSATLIADCNPLIWRCLNSSMQESISDANAVIRSLLIDYGLEPSADNTDALVELGDNIKIAKNDKRLVLSGDSSWVACQAVWLVALSRQTKSHHSRIAKIAKRARQSNFSLAKLNKIAISDENLSVEDELFCLCAAYSSQPAKALTWHTTEYSTLLSTRLANSTQVPDCLSDSCDSLTQDYCQILVRTFFERLTNLAKLRSTLELGKDNSYMIDLLAKLTDPAKPAIDDIVCKSVGISQSLRSSFGLFSNVIGKGSHPSDAGCLVIVMLGGVTAAEMDAFNNAFKSAPFQAVLFTSRILTCKDIVRDLLLE